MTGSRTICDRVAIVGMGCTAFGEKWGMSTDSLVIDATVEAAESAGISVEDVDAFWLGTYGSGTSGMMLSRPLQLDYKPVTRVENMCATGSEAFRSACYAVAAGVSDLAVAVGVEKLKDGGFSGLAITNPPSDATQSDFTAPALFSMLVPAYAEKWSVSPDGMREAMTHIAWKNHQNGMLNERAQFQKGVTKEAVNASPIVAGELRIHDCSGVSDGAAAAVICRAEDAYRYTDSPIFVKALSFVSGPGSGISDDTWDYASFPEVIRSAQEAYRQASVSDPLSELGFAEVHDCFTITELILMEDLGFSLPGTGWKDVLAGQFDLDGSLPINPDGGLKSFGHPVGASGLRMIFEAWLQLRGLAGDRQVPGILADPQKLALTQNLGGPPGDCVSFVGIFGSQRRT